MRVIAGSARSVRLITPDNKNTRPTTDKIKETLFNMLNFQLMDKNFLDLFAGSGGIGIEALSRGAKSCVFIDNDIRAIKCIKENLMKTKLDNKAKIFKTDYKNALNKLKDNIDDVGKFDFIFLDPPYDKNIEYEVLNILSNINILNNDAFVIIEQSNENEIKEMKAWKIIKIKEYKGKRHVFLQKTGGV